MGVKTPKGEVSREKSRETLNTNTYFSSKTLSMERGVDGGQVLELYQSEWSETYSGDLKGSIPKSEIKCYETRQELKKVYK